MSLLLVHAGATIAMTGLIWFVQIVHYPLLARVGHGSFAEYEQAHTRRTAFIVGPIMLLEAAAAAALAVTLRPPALLAAGLLVFIWLSTAVVQVPLHARLERGFDTSAWRMLVRSNWIRTCLWTVRAVLALHMVADSEGGASA